MDQSSKFEQRSTITKIESTSIFVCLNKENEVNRVFDVNFFTFIPIIGDFVLITTIKRKWKVIVEIQPWEPTKYRGKVRKINEEKGYGIIDRSVVFDVKTTLSQKQLRVGDIVKGVLLKGEFMFADKRFSLRCHIMETKAIEKNCFVPLEKELFESKNVSKVVCVDKSKLENANTKGWTLDEWKRMIQPNYSIPCSFEKVLLIDSKSGQKDALDELLRSNEDLNLDNYSEYFHGLLYLDEICIHQRFKDYNKEGVCFERRGKEFFLVLTHLFEKRPSIKEGDKIAARNCSSPSRIFYGNVARVERDGVCVSFGKGFEELFDIEHGSEKYDVEFTFSRTTFVRQHRAIDEALEIFDEKMLFPQQGNEANQPQLNVTLNRNNELLHDSKIVPWFNKQLNKYQKIAVTNVLRGEFKSLPYIVKGPPGTGKTTTLTEIVLKLLTLLESSRVIVVTSSNSAADLLTQRLVQSNIIDTKEMLRLVGFKQSLSSQIPDDIAELCCSAAELEKFCGKSETSGNRTFNRNWELLKNFRLVIATCVTIGDALTSDTLRNYFTHAIVDEAAQCLETEALIPMVLVGRNNGQVILSGDPMQMPPTVISKHAQNRGLSKTLFSRLLERYASFDDQSDSVSHNAILSKLLYNYRSSPSIMQFYSKHFYDSTLIATRSPSQEANYLALVCGEVFKDKNNNFGIYFVNVCCGENRRLKDSTSWLNFHEADEIEGIVWKLLNRLGMNEKDIGIITPYSLQKNVLVDRFKKWPGIKIGCIEEFQGQEREVILISTVRTCSKRIPIDVNRKLGFLKLPQRVNVAVSRARSLAIVCGKAKLLENDETWTKLIDECKSKGTFIDKCNTFTFETNS